MKWKSTLLIIMAALSIQQKAVGMARVTKNELKARPVVVAAPVQADSYFIYSSRGFDYLQKGDYDSAIAEYTKAIQLRPDFAGLYCSRGIAYSNKGNDDLAISDYNRAIELDPDDVDMYTMRAIIYRNRGDYDLAIADYNRVIQLKPDNVLAYLNRIAAYEIKGYYDRIIADCSKVIQLEPSYESVYYSRGLAYSNKGNYDRSITDYNKAIQLKPDYAMAYWKRGGLYSRNDDFLLAENDFEQAMSLFAEEEKAKLLIDWAISRQRAGSHPEKIQPMFDQAWQSDKKFIRIITNWALKNSQDIESTGNKLINITQGYMLYPEDVEPLRKMLALCAPEYDIITLKQAKLLDPSLTPSIDSSVEVVRRRQAVSAGTRDTKNAWAVVVGVAEYQYAQDGVMGNLVFAQKDADDFYSVLQNQGWAKDHIYKLTNEKANKRNIEYALETWLRKAKPEDMIIVFWSSHAWPDPGDSTKAYFACYDSKPSDPSSGWRMDRVLQILDERNVKNVVMIVDTCHAGKIIRAGDPKAIGVIPALEKMNTDRTIPNGWIFIASADSDRKAYEDKAWSNGALTHVLIEGISGQADGYQSLGPKDGSITMGELRGYVTDRMSEESLNILGARLTPLFYTTSGDPGIWDLSLMVK